MPADLPLEGISVEAVDQSLGYCEDLLVDGGMSRMPA
jgi:hypothetical protein